MKQIDTKEQQSFNASFPLLALEASSFRDPIAFIQQEHHRHKKICALLLEEQVLDAVCYKNDRHMVGFLYSFFLQELPNHIQDEEKALFPMMKERSTVAVDASALIEQVHQEHEFDQELTDFIVTDMERLHRGQTLVNPLRLALNLQTFAEGLIRHTNWENLTILPLAEKLLQPDDLTSISRNMAQRRNFGQIV